MIVRPPLIQITKEGPLPLWESDLKSKKNQLLLSIIEIKIYETSILMFL